MKAFFLWFENCQAHALQVIVWKESNEQLADIILDLSKCQ